MSLARDDSNLGMLLPLRSEMDLASYMELLIPEFQPAIGIAESRICDGGRGAAVILSAEIDDGGHPFVFEGCDPISMNLLFTPARPTLLGDDAYRRALIFVDQDGRISMGLSSFLYRHQGQTHFAPPGLVYQRNTRKDRRIPIEGNILLRKRDGRTILARLHDFSPSGASFYTDEAFVVGDTFLAEFEVLDCGACETVVTTARREALARGAPYRYLVGVKMQLTAAQRKKAEQLYLCKKAESMKRIVDSARSRHG
ncbi:MAG: PilZ domain-containing protein [Acidithiobacillus caldus]|nr:PilZ domain-containing protein [Acidithiobacillus caldus]WMT47844.1 MAG: PilZ domain-containing protein [Acidithiobacillus caldus]